MVYKIYLLLLIVICGSSLVNPYIVLAQNPEANLLKYWYYRDRLKKDFMICVCSDFGGSIPASVRSYQEHFLKWGDATTDLGYYIGVLATEYYLLDKFDESTNETAAELYYAMNAINRLDFVGDLIYWPAGLSSQPNNLNGFFLRDDVATDLNPFLISAITDNDPNFDYRSDAKNFFNNPNNDMENYLGPEESKDQIIHLLEGLALVVKLMPPNLNASTNFMDTESNFVQEAKNIIDRLVYYMHMDGDPWGNWTIYNPNIGLTPRAVHLGANGYFLSIGFSEAQELVSGSSNNPPSISPMYVGATTAWNNSNSDVVIRISRGEYSKWLSLDALAQSYHLYLMPDLYYNAWVIGKYNIVSPWAFEYIPLLNSVLNQAPLILMPNHWSNTCIPNLKSYYENLLNDAPCLGPYNRSYANQFFHDPFSNTDVPLPIGAHIEFPSFEWSSTSRLLHAERRGEYHPDFRGDYNGLDYMLYFNMYYIEFLAAMEPYKKSTNAVQFHDYPYITNYSPQLGFGSHSSPLQLNSFNTIVASNHVYPDGDVTYRASETITLLNGFTTDIGSNFLAYIDPISCINDEWQRSLTNETNHTISIPKQIHNDPKDLPFKKNSTLDVQAFPNPARNSVTVRVNLPFSSQVNISLFNMMAQPIANIALEKFCPNGITDFNYNLNNVTPGVYYLNVKTENAEKMLKVIKTK